MGCKRAWLVLCIFLFAAAIWAQVVITSTVVGSVTDPQAAVIPAAQVVLRNLDTGVEARTKTDSSGDYQFSNLQAGHYQVLVDAPGFGHAVSTSIP